MRVLLVRHGEAIPLRDCDENRWLSGRGRDDVRAVSATLRARNVLPDQIFASPLVRAIQTAELIGSAVGYMDEIRVDVAFEPDSDPAIAERVLAKAVEQHPDDLVMVATHEPVVHRLAALLVGAKSFPHFRTAACTLIESAQVVFTLEP